MLSPVAVLARDLDVIIYDCRPPIIPVSIKLKGHQNNVVVSTVLASLAALSGEVGLQCGASLPERDAEAALMSGLSSDVGTDLEDELCRFQPLPETLSLLSNSSVVNLPMSLSRYPAPAVPEVTSVASVTQKYPTLVRRVHPFRLWMFFRHMRCPRMCQSMNRRLHQ